MKEKMDIERYMRFPYEMQVEETPKEGGFYVSYPQLPGCNAFGSTREEAVERAEQSKRKWLETALRTGIEIPIPHCGFEAPTIGKMYPSGTKFVTNEDGIVERVILPDDDSMHVAMYGAILGDIIGSPYEFDRGDKTKDFVFFDNRKWVHYTDDTAMTLAIAKAILEAGPGADENTMKEAFIACMQDYGHRYAAGEYGGRFAGWLRAKDPQPYGSFGNGSAMRVSAVGWCFDTLERTREVARWSAEVTHNHPEGIKGAESVAAAIYLLRTGSTMKEVKEFICREFGYDLSRTLDEIRPGYHHVESCQETVPEAITAFLESVDFEDAIRNAVSLGGDCDTLTCITGSMAEAFYGVPKELVRECEERLPEELLQVLKEYQKIIL